VWWRRTRARGSIVTIDQLSYTASEHGTLRAGAQWRWREGSGRRGASQRAGNQRSKIKATDVRNSQVRSRRAIQKTSPSSNCGFDPHAGREDPGTATRARGRSPWKTSPKVVMEWSRRRCFRRVFTRSRRGRGAHPEVAVLMVASDGIFPVFGSGRAPHRAATARSRACSESMCAREGESRWRRRFAKVRLSGRRSADLRTAECCGRDEGAT